MKQSRAESDFARSLRRNTTEAESKLWAALRARPLVIIRVLLWLFVLLVSPPMAGATEKARESPWILGLRGAERMLDREKPDTAEAVLGAALGALGDGSADPLSYGRVLALFAKTYRQQGYYRRSLDWADRAVAHLESLGDQRTLAEARLIRGRTEIKMGLIRAAEADCRAAADYFDYVTAKGRFEEVVESKLCRAEYLHFVGEWADSHRLLSESLTQLNRIAPKYSRLGMQRLFSDYESLFAMNQLIVDWRRYLTHWYARAESALSRCIKVFGETSQCAMQRFLDIVLLIDLVEWPKDRLEDLRARFRSGTEELEKFAANSIRNAKSTDCLAIKVGYLGAIGKRIWRDVDTSESGRAMDQSLLNDVRLLDVGHVQDCGIEIHTGLFQLRLIIGLSRRLEEYDGSSSIIYGAVRRLEEQVGRDNHHVMKLRDWVADLEIATGVDRGVEAKEFRAMWSKISAEHYELQRKIFEEMTDKANFGGVP